MKNIKLNSEDEVRSPFTLKFLQREQLSLIEEALISIGDYGEVRLVIEKGRLRFLVLQKSLDVLKDTTGKILEFKR